MLKLSLNNTKLINEIMEMTAEQVTALVESGQYNVTLLEVDPKVQYRDVPIAGEWSLSYYKTRDRSSPDFGLVRVTIHSKSPNNRRSKQIGEQAYAEACGLTPDHAFNWRNSFISNRYALLPAIIAIASDPEVLKYITNPPSVADLIDPTKYNSWITACPTDSPDVVMVNRAEYRDLARLVDIVIRDRLSFAERHELREDHFERVAQNKGLPYTRKPVPAPRAPTDRRNDRPRTDTRSSRGYKSANPTSTPRETMVRHIDDPAKVKEFWQTPPSKDVIELDQSKSEGLRRKQRQEKGRQREQNRRESRWN